MNEFFFLSSQTRAFYERFGLFTALSIIVEYLTFTKDKNMPIEILSI